MLLVNLLFICTIVTAQSARFKVIYEWNFINFTWPTEEDHRQAIAQGRYVLDNVHISGVKFFEDYLYITLPRMREGVPATLARIPYTSNEKDTAPPLMPYPSWDMNREGDCNALQNVQNVEIDTQGILWILDIGRTNTLMNPINKCPPRLIIYDTKNNSTLRTYTFPQEMTNNGSFLYDLVLDDVDGGYAYISDNSGPDPAIIVYSMRQNNAWIIRDESMRAATDAIEFSVNGTMVTAPINVASIALGPRTMSHDDHDIVSQDRIVYFAPLSSYHLFSVSSAVLRDQRSASTGIASQVKDVGIKSSQTDGMVMDENGVLYYGLLADNSIGRWDSRTPFASGQKVIARDRTYIQWPDSLAFDMSGNLLVVTNKLQRFIYGKLDNSEPNFRILEASVGGRSYLYGTDQSNMPTDHTMNNNQNQNNNNNNNGGKLYYDTVTTETADSTTMKNMNPTQHSSGTTMHSKFKLFTAIVTLAFLYVSQ